MDELAGWQGVMLRSRCRPDYSEKPDASRLTRQKPSAYSPSLDRRMSIGARLKETEATGKASLIPNHSFFDPPHRLVPPLNKVTGGAGDGS